MMLTLLTGLVPLIITLGNFLIGLFVKDQAAATQAKTDFLNTIMKHANDALASVNEHTQFQNQVTELKAIADAADRPKPMEKSQ